MIIKEDIDNLCHLARLEISDTEKEGLVGDMKQILAYVDQLSEVKVEKTNEIPEHRNIFRGDDEEYKTSVADDLVDAFPDKHGRFNKVKKVIK